MSDDDDGDDEEDDDTAVRVSILYISTWNISISICKRRTSTKKSDKNLEKLNRAKNDDLLSFAGREFAVVIFSDKLKILVNIVEK